eukprot:TRINITY_DN2740_c0_g1_i2.p1 TRINITY_DN2740_c0_g1~~TRINITY_DN2740_c0_g1_i2.p1  ORF type:complete len:518 (-),score=92.16 TRINITY_DN2740_c0_g1_i2:1083-2636(-)
MSQEEGSASTDTGGSKRRAAAPSTREAGAKGPIGSSGGGKAGYQAQRPPARPVSVPPAGQGGASAAAVSSTPTSAATAAPTRTTPPASVAATVGQPAAPGNLLEATSATPASAIGTSGGRQLDDLVRGLREALPSLDLDDAALRSAAEHVSAVVRPAAATTAAPDLRDLLGTGTVVTTSSASAAITPSAQEIERAANEIKVELDRRIALDDAAYNEAYREVQEAGTKMTELFQERERRPPPPARPSRLQLTLEADQDTDWAKLADVQHRRKVLATANVRRHNCRLVRSRRIQDYFNAAQRTGPEALADFVINSAPALFANAAQRAREDDERDLVDAGHAGDLQSHAARRDPLLAPSGGSDVLHGLPASAAPRAPFDGGFPAPAAASAAVATARPGDWQKFFSPTIMPIPFKPGTTDEARNLFEQAALYNQVPRAQWDFALRRCLTPEQREQLILVRRDPITNTERVQSCGSMSYEQMWEAIRKRFDNATTRAEALFEITDIVWRPEWTPRRPRGHHR